MPNLSHLLTLNKCPHCTIANPYLSTIHSAETKDHEGGNLRRWRIYTCGNCGGIVTASGATQGGLVQEIFPSQMEIHYDIPERGKAYLTQAVDSIHAPAGAVMLAASSVDAMLKDKGYTNGSLYSRIESAVDDNLLTTEMATWAHEVRLDANDQRHSDDDAILPTSDDAKKVIDFTMAIAEYLFVLPAKVQRGLSN